MNWLNLIGLMQHMAVVILFLVIGNRLYPSVIHRTVALKNGMHGLLFGTAGILTMLIPFQGGAGTLAPMYHIVAALAAWVGGPLSALVSAGLMLGVRVALGGVGMETGIVAIGLASAIGLVYRRLRPADREGSLGLVHPALIGVLVSAASMGSAAFMLPEEVRSTWLWHSAPSTIVVFPVSSMLFHYFMNSEWTRKRRYAIDEKSGLMSSALFLQQIRKWIDARTPFYLALLDIDGFKIVNAINCELSRAHLLNQVSQRLKNWMPDNALVCRLEREEFLIVMTDPSFRKLPDVSLEIWDELQTLLSSPYSMNRQLYHLTTHIGVTAYWNEAITVEELLPRAYAALQHAKDSGLQQVVQYHEKLTMQIRRRTMIEVHVRTALQHNQLHLQYQPQYEVHSGRLRGFEALLRWEHPELGSVDPKEFIPLAESTQSMIGIGEWVVRQACLTLMRVAPSPSSLTVSVNLSASQLLDPGFADIVEQVLSDTGIDPQRLELEIAEHTLAGSFDKAELPMKRLRAFGVRLAIDDYGLGATTLPHLRRLPVQAIKIDNHLMLETAGASDRELNDSLFESLKLLPCEIVATRLETYEQLAFYKKHECHFAQGNLLGRPMDGERLPALIGGVQLA